MKNTELSKTKKGIKLNARQKHIQAEADARRKVAQKWEYLSHSTKYQSAAAKTSSHSLTQTLKEELFDGIFLNLHGDVANRSYRNQKRTLRRIVEKRQAQSTHRIMGRTEDRYAHYVQHLCISHSIK